MHHQGEARGWGLGLFEALSSSGSDRQRALCFEEREEKKKREEG